MRTITIEQIKEIAKCTHCTAVEVKYCDILEKCKLYTDRGNNSRATMNWLSKHDVEFTYGNDAPRGGKIGNFVSFKMTDKLAVVKNALDIKDAQLTIIADEKEAARDAAIEAMVITEEEANKFIQKVTGLSNKHARKIAHNMAAAKLGFYSKGGRDRFMHLINS